MLQERYRIFVDFFDKLAYFERNVFFREFSLTFSDSVYMLGLRATSLTERSSRPAAQGLGVALTVASLRGTWQHRSALLRMCWAWAVEVQNRR